MDYSYYSWFKNRRVHSTTKSKCTRVLDLYNLIIENEFSDGDFWHAIGDNDLIRTFVDFSPGDFTNLKKDMPNWKSNQLEIFGHALQLDRVDDAFKDQLISERSDLYCYVLTLVDNESFIQLVDFIGTTILRGNHKPKLLLENISYRLAKLEGHQFASNKLLIADLLAKQN